MTLIVLNKDVRQKCTVKEVAYLEKVIREMVAEKEKSKVIFMPWPYTQEELEQYKDENIEVDFLPINPGKLDRLVMFFPLYDKSRGCNIWNVQFKGEEVQLDIKTTIKEGHHRTRPK